MEHSVSLLDTLLNIGFQVFNIALFFFLFIKFAGKGLTNAIFKEIEKEKKLAAADEEYQSIIADAHKEKNKLIDEGKSHKAQLLQEAAMLAKQKEEEVLAQAHGKAESILSSAESRLKLMEEDLMNEFESSVKQTAKMVVKKLIKSDKEIQSAYLDTLVKEVKSTS